jgi:hypothetical protein
MIDQILKDAYYHIHDITQKSSRHFEKSLKVSDDSLHEPVYVFDKQSQR